MKLLKGFNLIFLVIAALIAISAARNIKAAAPQFPPCCLQAASITSSEIDLSWSGIDVSGQGITGYRIERESPLGNGFAIVTANTGSTAVTYADTGLAPSTAYNYRVSAVNSDGASSPSNSDYAVTQNAPNTSLAAQPLNLTATPASGTEIYLSWTAPQNAPPVLGYKIEREIGIGGGFSTIAANTGSTATNYTDTNLALGATYNYRVTAIYSYGFGISSVSASATTLTQPGPPQNVRATAGDSRVTVSWLPPSYGGSVSNYIVVGGSNFNSSTTLAANATNTIITGLFNGSAYSFSVAARNAAGTGMSVTTDIVVPQAQTTSSIPAVIPASTATATVQSPITANPSSATTAPLSPSYIFVSPLTKGMRNKAVTELQKRLVVLGYLKAEPTGYFGILSEAAVKAYQTARGIDPLGGVGPLTRAALNSGK